MAVLRSCDCLCTVALNHGVMGWPVVCDCGISGSYSFAFYIRQFSFC